MRDPFGGRTENASIEKAAVLVLEAGLPPDPSARRILLRQHLGDGVVRTLPVSGTDREVARAIAIAMLRDFGDSGRQSLAKLVRDLMEESPDATWCTHAESWLHSLERYQPPPVISDLEGEPTTVQEVHSSIQRVVSRGAPPLRVKPAVITAAAEDMVSTFDDYVSRCIADAARRPVGDRRFIALSLLTDRRKQGQAQGAERFSIERSRYESLREALTDNTDSELVVVGPPGAGKSTLAAQLQFELCQSLLKGEPSPLPFLLHLGGYGQDETGKVPSPDVWLESEWSSVMTGMSLRAAMAERPFVLLLDALNEMPREDDSTLGDRIAVWQRWLARFHERTKGRHRVIFTCRTRDLSASLTSATRSVRLLEIDGLDDDRVRRFLEEHANAHSDAIQTRLKEDRRLRELYRTPLSLTLLLDLIDLCGAIPSTPAALFTGHLCHAVRREIDHGNPRFKAGRFLTNEDIRHMVLCPYDVEDPYVLPDDGPLFRALSALAFAMQKGDQGERTHVVMKLRQARQLYNGLDVAQSLRFEDLLVAASDLGLVIQQNGKIAFVRQPHQEYLAARAWAESHRDYTLVAPPWTNDTRDLAKVVAKVFRRTNLYPRRRALAGKRRFRWAARWPKTTTLSRVSVAFTFPWPVACVRCAVTSANGLDCNKPYRRSAATRVSICAFAFRRAKHWGPLVIRSLLNAKAPTVATWSHRW